MSCLRSINRSLFQNLLLISIGISIILPVGCQLTDEEKLAFAQSSPVEDISKNSVIKQHLQEHKNFISLTTSPTRIRTLKLVLDALDLTHIEKILLVLPDKYDRTGEPYVVPDEITNYPKMHIIHISKDLGPISKLLPAIEYVKDTYKDPEAIVITIDDDNAYPRGQINGLLKHMILYDEVATAAGLNIDSFNVSRQDWPQSELLSPKCDGFGRCDLVEGFAGIVYRIKHIQKAGGIKELTRLSKLGRQCFLSDDLVISFALAKAGVPRFAFKDAFVFRPTSYSFSTGEDALHRGSGVGGGTPNNLKKEQDCFELFLSKESVRL